MQENKNALKLYSHLRYDKTYKYEKKYTKVKKLVHVLIFVTVLTVNRVVQLIYF